MISWHWPAIAQQSSGSMADATALRQVPAIDGSSWRSLASTVVSMAASVTGKILPAPSPVSASGRMPSRNGDPAGIALSNALREARNVLYKPARSPPFATSMKAIFQRTDISPFDGHAKHEHFCSRSVQPALQIRIISKLHWHVRTVRRYAAHHWKRNFVTPGIGFFSSYGVPVVSWIPTRRIQ